MVKGVKISNAQMVALANALIRPASGVNVVKFADGDTRDIITQVMETFKKSPPNVSFFAQKLRGPNLGYTCQNVWRFVKNNIGYQLDPNGYQFIQTPSATWKRRKSDCKGYSIFIRSTLEALNIPSYFRFTSYSVHNKRKTHVYVIVPAKPRPMIIDCCMTQFHKEKKYEHKTDLA